MFVGSYGLLEDKNKFPRFVSVLWLKKAFEVTCVNGVLCAVFKTSAGSLWKNRSEQRNLVSQKWVLSFSTLIKFDNYWIRLSMIRRIMEIKEGFIRPRWITPSEIQSIILQIIRNYGLILRRPRSMAVRSLLSINLGRLRIKSLA